MKSKLCIEYLYLSLSFHIQYLPHQYCKKNINLSATTWTLPKRKFPKKQINQFPFNWANLFEISNAFFQQWNSQKQKMEKSKQKLLSTITSFPKSPSELYWLKINPPALFLLSLRLMTGNLTRHFQRLFCRFWCICSVDCFDILKIMIYYNWWSTLGVSILNVRCIPLSTYNLCVWHVSMTVLHVPFVSIISIKCIRW